jgi:hypothetical protein
MLFGCLAGLFESAGGVLVCLAGQLVSGEAALTLGGCGGSMRVRSKIM